MAAEQAGGQWRGGGGEDRLLKKGCGGRGHGGNAGVAAEEVGGQGGQRGSRTVAQRKVPWEGGGKAGTGLPARL